MNFTDLNLSPDILEAINDKNFVAMTPIQEVAFEPIVEGRDVSGLAQTGTGKTAAFVVPLLERIARTWEQQKAGPIEDDKLKARPFAGWQSNNYILVLVPTRELAEQVHNVVLDLGRKMGVNSAVIYGGTSYEKQRQNLNQGVQFIVATPGRLIDLYKDHVIDLKQVKCVVFDEADRMFDMGFKDDTRYILQRIPRERQYLVFSATMNFDVTNFAYEFGADPIEINLSRDEAKAENVQDEILHVGHFDKPQFLLSIVKKYQPRQAIVFSNYKMNVDRIAQFLSDNGFPAQSISSLLTQSQRNRIMEHFRTAQGTSILVATDLAARGLDVKGVDLVVNFELPDNPENYVHRIGRTGRAGEKGRAVGLSGDRDVEALQRIEDYLGHKVTIGWIEDGELVKEFRPFPREMNFEKVRSGQNWRKQQTSGGPRRESGRDRGGRGRGRGPRRDQAGGDAPGGMHRDRLSGRHRTPEGAPPREAPPGREAQGHQNRHGQAKDAGRFEKRGGHGRDRQDRQQRPADRQQRAGGQNGARPGGDRQGQQPRHERPQRQDQRARNRTPRPHSPGVEVRVSGGRRDGGKNSGLAAKVTKFLKSLFE